MIYSNFELLSKLVNAQMLDPQHLKLVVQDLYYCNLARKYSCVMGYFHDYSKVMRIISICYAFMHVGNTMTIKMNYVLDHHDLCVKR